MADGKHVHHGAVPVADRPQLTGLAYRTPGHALAWLKIDGPNSSTRMTRPSAVGAVQGARTRCFLAMKFGSVAAFHVVVAFQEHRVQRDPRRVVGQTSLRMRRVSEGWVSGRPLRRCPHAAGRTVLILVFLRLDPDTVEPEERSTRDMRGIGHLGTGGLEIRIPSAADPEKAGPLIRRACEGA